VKSRADILVHDDAFLLGIARYAPSKAHRPVLQFALAALIADRTIERVVDQQEFHRRFLCGKRLLRARLHHHAVHALRSAGRHWLRRTLDFHQAHAAISRNREALVIAETRDHNIVFVRHVDQQATRLGFDLLTVDGDFDVIAHC
jgi:hypothetical protein